ncbi:MAG: response regulator [Planctomycetota bacterium]
MSANEKFRILLVDDDDGIRDSLAEFLVDYGYQLVTASDAGEAIRVLESRRFDLVLTDISMPGLSGLELLKHVKRLDDTVDVIMISGFLDISYAIQAMRQGAYDFFTKPFNFQKVQMTIERVREKQGLARDAERLSILQRERELALETTFGLARAAEERDYQNVGHGKRVGEWSARLGRKLCFSEEKIEQLRCGGRLHDIGKIGVDDAILNKPGRLTTEEFAAMKRHSEIGEYIIKPISLFKEVEGIVRWHHERWDGTGYPDGLKGEEIPLDARIVCIADFFDAVTSLRPYRKPAPIEEALAMVREQSGTMFDPMLAEVFCDMIAEELGTPTATAEIARARS